LAELPIHANFNILFGVTDVFALGMVDFHSNASHQKLAFR